MTAKAYYQTMTTAGLPGNQYLAETIEEAASLAEKDGYEVLDYADPDTLVVANHRTSTFVPGERVFVQDSHDHGKVVATFGNSGVYVELSNGIVVNAAADRIERVSRYAIVAHRSTRAYAQKYIDSFADELGDTDYWNGRFNVPIYQTFTIELAPAGGFDIVSTVTERPAS